MLVGRHAETDDLPTLDVDDDALDRRDVRVAWQRILPRFESRVSDCRVHEIHIARAPLVLLVGGDPLRVRRPQEDRTAAPGPARVVRGVAVVLHAVVGQLRLAAAVDVAYPQIPVPDECGSFTVRRTRLV